MLNILGVGYAFPPTIIDNESIERISSRGSLPSNGAASLRRNIEQEYGIQARASVLPLSYIEETENCEPMLGEKAALETPTDLAYRASLMALERAGIRAEELGLIIGDTTTPVETTPAEAQRVGRRFGLKIPAYDVTVSSISLVAHLDILSAWRPTAFPRYALCVSTHTPTQTILFGSKKLSSSPSLRVGQDKMVKYLFGDGAYAMVLSFQEQGKLQVLDSFFQSDPSAVHSCCIDRLGFLHLEHGILQPRVTQLVDQNLGRALASNSLDAGQITFIGSACGSAALRTICMKHGVREAHHWYNLDRQADTLGASAGSVMGQHWEELQKGQTIVVALAGMGIQYGYVVLRAYA